MYKKNRIILRVCALMLACFLLLPGTAHGAVIEPAQPYASDYLTGCSAYIDTTSNGVLKIWFTAMGDTNMDELGALHIILYESTDQSIWMQAKTFTPTNYPAMLAENDWLYTSYVPYDGVAGRYYKALIRIWAGKDGGGDSRYVWTAPVKAT